MLATIYITTKGIRNQTMVLEGLTTLLEEKGFEVVRNDDRIHISGDVNNLATAEKTSQQMCEEAIVPKSALQNAHAIVHGDREQTYGDAGKNLRTIAAYWNTHLLAAKSIEARLTEDDVCGMMRLLKEARLATNPQHRDSLVDVAGYVELQDVVNLQKQKS
jgi:hypothetical protein